MEKLTFKDFELNKVFDFGNFILTDQEIIDFALVYDPLDFHINKELAQKSMFKALIASGPQLFHIIYIAKWLPLFKDTVLGGLEVNWKFLKPVYAGMKIYCKTTIVELKPNPLKNYALVKWHHEFTNENGDFFQTIDITVMHSMA